MKSVLLAGAIALMPAAAFAADGFARIDGIDGDALDKGRTGWMTIDTLTEGLSHIPPSSSGSGGGAGKPVFQPVTFTRTPDSASPALRDAVATGRRFPSATIELAKAGETPFVYYRISLKNVAVQSVDLAAGPGSVSEAVSLDYGEITWEFIKQDPKGAPGVKKSATAVVN